MTDYDSINALNWSTLKLLATSPRLLKYRSIHRRKDTASLHMGRAIHAALLEPDEWARYVVKPEFSGTGSKAARADWMASHAGLNIIDAEDKATVEACAESVRGHREAMAVIAGGRREEIIRWTDAETGLECKARLDNVRPRDFTEIKSTRRANPRLFLRDAAEYLYHGQTAFYHAGAIAAGVLPADAELPKCVVVQTCEPFDVMVFRMPEAVLSAGRTLWQSLIRRFAECQAADFWPGIAPGILEYSLPPWADCGDGERWQEEQF